MRIISLLLRSAIALTIIAAISFLAAREVFLFMGTSKLREGLSAARALRLSPGAIAPQCQASAITDPTQAVVEQIQLTFTSKTEFELQIVCRAALRDPVTISRFSLPPFVEKVPGTSGLIWGEGVTGVTIESWGRRRSLILENQNPTFVNGFLPAGIGTGPMASCQGYGFSCCSPDSSVGQGLQTTLVNDCPRSCFSQCISRPVILSFNSQPFYDVETRIVSIASGEQVTFNFVVDPGQGQTAQTMLEFGDGEEYTSDDTSGSVSHTYTCRSNTCEYPVTLLVRDSRGTESAASPVSRLVVRVSGS